MSNDSLPTWVKLPNGYSAEKSGDSITVKNSDYPEFYMDISISKGENNPAATFAAKFKEYEHSLEQYHEQRGKLRTKHGFEFSNENGNLVAKVPDYDFEYSIPATSKSETAFKNLQAIEEALEEKSLEAVGKLEELEKQGFTIKKSEKGIDSNDVVVEISHEKLEKPVQITLRGELEIINNTDMKKLGAALIVANTPAITKEGVEIIQPAPVLQNFQEIPNHTPKPELAGKDKVSLVFDANPIFLCCSKSSR